MNSVRPLPAPKAVSARGSTVEDRVGAGEVAEIVESQADVEERRDDQRGVRAVRPSRRTSRSALDRLDRARDVAGVRLHVGELGERSADRGGVGSQGALEDPDRLLQQGSRLVEPVRAAVDGADLRQRVGHARVIRAPEPLADHQRRVVGGDRLLVAVGAPVGPPGRDPQHREHRIRRRTRPVAQRAPALEDGHGRVGLVLLGEHGAERVAGVDPPRGVGVREPLLDAHAAGEVGGRQGVREQAALEARPPAVVQRPCRRARIRRSLALGPLQGQRRHAVRRRPAARVEQGAGLIEPGLNLWIRGRGSRESRKRAEHGEREGCRTDGGQGTGHRDLVGVRLPGRA